MAIPAHPARCHRRKHDTQGLGLTLRDHLKEGSGDNRHTLGFDYSQIICSSLTSPMPPKIDTSDQVTKGYHGTTLAVAQDVMQTYITMSPPVHGEFVIKGPRSSDPAPLLLSPMLGKLLVHEKCDFSDGASAGQTGHSPGNWRDPSRSRGAFPLEVAAPGPGALS